MMMALLEALAVLGVVVVVACVTYALVRGAGQPQRTLGEAPPRWVATHYTVNTATRVVVRRVGSASGDVLDEHFIAEISDGDPDFDVKFLEAMAQARARVALFESESD
ncbi:MAG TPA: hypothetical protein VHI11_10470 [Jiangellaceae bacterium]|jgi:hypothetical protein|nr:hypothetical protein [Jiangellaceae bacterium]